MDTVTFKNHFLPLSEEMYRIGINYFSNRDETLDAIQDTYVKLWDKKDNLSHVQNLQGFAITTFKRVCIDKIRSKKDIINKIIVPEDTNREQEIIADEGKHKILRWISNQKEPGKTIFLKRFITENTIAEIASETKLSQGNIRVILSRMRKELKQYLNDEREN